MRYLRLKWLSNSEMVEAPLPSLRGGTFYNAIQESLRRPMIALTLAAVIILGVVYPLWWSSAPILVGDSPGYQEVAQDIETHGSLTELHFRAPGYPVMLWLTGSAYEPGRALLFSTLFLHLVAVVMLVKVLQHLGLPLWALITTGVIGLTPPFVEPAAFVMTETLAAFFLVGSFWLLTFVKRPWVSGTTAGLFIGLAALTRPAYQLLGIALFFVVLLSRRRKRAFALVVSSSLIIGGFALFNLHSFGYFGVTPALGWNMSTRTWRVIERLPESPVREILIAQRNRELLEDKYHTAQMYIWDVDRSDLSSVTGLEGVALDKFMISLNLFLIQSAPLTYLEEVGAALAGYWFPPFAGITNNSLRWIQFIWSASQIGLIVLFFLQVIVVVGNGLVRGVVFPSMAIRTVYILGMSYIIYTMAVSCFLEVGIPRYRLPTEGILLITTVIGLHVWRRLRSRQTSPASA